MIIIIYNKDYSLEVNIEPDNKIKQNKTLYFTPKTSKLIIMSILTFGIYEAYWFYKNWKVIKENTNENMMPFFRAFFFVIWAYLFFDTVKREAIKNQIKTNISSGLYAFIYFVLIAISSLADYYLFISLLSVLILVPINNLLFENNKNASNTYKEKEKFTIWNWILITVFLSFLFLFPLIEKYTGLSSNYSLNKKANNLNKDLPRMLSTVIRLDKVTGANNTLRYQYTIVNYDAKYMNENRIDYIRKFVTKYSCKTLNDDIYFKNGVIFKYVYLGKLEKELISLVITKDKCEKNKKL